MLEGSGVDGESREVVQMGVGDEISGNKATEGEGGIGSGTFVGKLEVRKGTRG